MWMTAIQQDLKSNNLSLNEAIDMAQKSESSTLKTDVYVYVVHAKKEEKLQSLQYSR